MRKNPYHYTGNYRYPTGRGLGGGLATGLGTGVGAGGGQLSYVEAENIVASLFRYFGK